MGNVVDRPLGIMRHRSDPQSGSTRRAPAPGARRRGSARPFALLVAIVVVIAGCGRTYYTPEIAGVVVANGVQVDGGGGVRLADGTGVPLGGRMRQVYGGGSPNVGDLLLTGSTPEPWMARVGAGLGASAGCFWIGGAGEEEFNGVGHTSYVNLDVGLRVPEAPDIDKGGWPTGERWETAGVCLNERGEVYKVSTAGLGG